MLRTPSSPISNDGLDFDFFAEPKITDTGTTATECSEALYVVDICGKSLKLAKDPLVGTGGLLWPAGESLARYLCKHEDLIRDKHILELGSGTGVVGLSIASQGGLGTGKVTLTDLHTVLPVLETNTCLNALTDVVAVRELAWGEPIAADLGDNQVFLLADCVYLESLFQPLVDSLLQLMTCHDQVAYLCYKKRRKADSRFFKLLRRHFTLQSLKIDDEAARKNGIQLYKFTKKHGR